MKSLNQALKNIWLRPIPKAEAQGIHGLLFYQWKPKKSTIQREKMRKQ
jgi:hypothetical protein